MSQKVAAVLGAFLLIVLIVQGFFLYRMSGQVKALSQAPTVTSQIPDKPSSNNIKQGNPLDAWNPFEEMQQMQNEMNKIFGDMRSNFYKTPELGNMFKSFSFSPTLDMQEEDDKFIVKVDLPGSDASNINVKVDNQRLTVSATTKKSADDKNTGSMFRSERFMGRFERSVTLPAPVLADKMKTDYKDGVLIITIPKA